MKTAYHGSLSLKKVTIDQASFTDLDNSDIKGVMGFDTTNDWMVYIDAANATRVVPSGTTTIGVLIDDAKTTGISITGVTTTGISITAATSNQLAITTTAGATGFTVTGTAQTANDLCTITAATAVTSAAVMKAFSVGLTTSGASAVNMIEAARFTVTSAVKNGVWMNAITGKIDLTTAGHVTGLAGVVCAELNMPSTDPAGGSGTYTCYEAELGIPNAYTSTVPVSFMNMNVWGTGGAGGVGVFLDNGFIFDITGLGSAATTHIFQANTATAASHALRIRIDGVPYYIMLTDTGA